MHLEAMEYFHLKEAYLITKDEKETLDKKIFILPMVEWLLREDIQ